MKIIYKKLDEIKPYENNPRNNDNAVDPVAKSIKEFGFKVPIVIDKDGVIIAGHTRLKAAEKIGMKEIPTIVAEDLSPEQIRAFRLADNKVSEFATWDFNKLDAELAELAEDFDLDMSDFGFEHGEALLDEYGESFNLPDGEKEPFQQMTFTLADNQAKEIKSAISLAKQDNNIETYGNENSNGNAIFRIVREWEERKI